MKTKATVPPPLPTITLDSRPVYIVEGCHYGTYDDAIKHILRDQISTLYDETGMGYNSSFYDIGGWVCDNLDRIIALRAAVKTITAQRKEASAKKPDDGGHPNEARWLAEGP